MKKTIALVVLTLGALTGYAQTDKAPAPGKPAAPAAPAVGQTVKGSDEQLTKGLQQLVDTYQRVRAGSGDSGGSSGQTIPPLDAEMTALVKAGLLRALPAASGGKKFVYNAANGKVEIK